MSRLQRLRTRARRAVGIRLVDLVQYPPRPLETAPPDPRPLPAGAPSFSIVTPSLDQAAFLPRTIESVLSQGYPRLEYGVQDGGSTDGTREILERERPRLAFAVSERDRGQADALNRAFARTSGEVLAWINSDDFLLPGALATVARAFAARPDVDVIYGHRILVDADGDEIGRWVLPASTHLILPWADWIPQETLFFRRRIWERSGGRLDESFHYALDWDLLLRFRDRGARFLRVPKFLGAFRIHPAQKTTAWFDEHGAPEMARLRGRALSRLPTAREIQLRVLPFLLRHAIRHRLWQTGILRGG